MKNLISKVTLLLLCSVFAFSSCSDNDDSVDKKTVSLQYRILVSADVSYKGGTKDGGIEKLYTYTEKEMDAVAKAYNKETWIITESADTEEEAIAACDQKAIAVFSAQIAAINTSAAAVKTKFDAKKAELLSAIATDLTTAHVIYSNYGGHLFRGEKDDPIPTTVVKDGILLDFQAVGGEK